MRAHAFGTAGVALAAALALGGCGGSGDDDASAVPASGDDSVAADPVSIDPVATAPAGAPGPAAPPGASPGEPAAFRPDQVVIEGASGPVETVVDAYDDALGAVVVQERFVDDAPSEERRYAYDARGRLETRVDLRAGTDEVLRTAVFTYADDALAAVDVVGADGTLGQRRSYEFDADGLVEASSLEALADEAGAPIAGGLLIERVEYAYANGRLAAESVDENGDGSVERTRDYAYLPDGRLDTITTVDAAAGTTDVETWRYERGPCSLAWANSLFAHFCVAPPDGD